MNSIEPEILKILGEETGLEADSIGDVSINRSVRTAMHKLGITNNQAFVKEILKNKKSLQVLIEEIKVSETWFFRDIESFNLFKSYISENKSNFDSINKLRILSSPCSTGEEPYSIAMSILDMGIPKSYFEINACDISVESISKAKSGLYTKSSFRVDYFDFKNRYFTAFPHNFEIKDEVKELVSFSCQNMVKTDFLINDYKYDIIFCKNLFIYLNDESRQIVLNNILRLLKENGILFVGLSELNYLTRNGFEQINYSMSFACKRLVKNEDNLLQTKIRNITEQNKPRQRQDNYRKENIKFENFKIQLQAEQNETKDNNDQELYVNDLLLQLKSFSDNGKYIEAHNIGDKILEFDKTNITALFTKGMLYNADKSFDKAKEFFSKVLYLDPKHYESLIYMSLIEESSGRTDKAEIFKSRAEKSFFQRG